MEVPEDVPNLSEDEDAGDESDGWDEMETNGEQTTCLFCTSQFRTIAVALDHCRSEHNFDLLELKTKYNMDCYSFIKMINYIRQHKPNPSSLINSDVAVWNDDIYLKPGATETWLMYDFEDLGSTPSTPNITIDTNKSLPNMSFTDLQRTIVELTNQLQEKDSLLIKAMEDINKMKKITRNLVESTNIGDSSSIKDTEKCVANVRLENDQGYFNTYAHFGIHHEMLSDRVRTESYRDAILGNSAQFQGKRILDLGCGTGILSMFCAKAGAETVWGIDQSDILYRAMDIVRENNLHEKIQLVRGRLEDGMVPFEKVDIIVSEWMGYFLLFEGMLDSVIYAREKHLAPGGLLLPNRCNISIAGSGDIDDHRKHIAFWNDVYGFGMKCMMNEVVQEASVDVVPAEKIITKPEILTEINIATCDIKAVDFTADFNLSVLRDGQLTALVGYFDTFFDLPNPVTFSTGPHAMSTHWKQTIFYLKDPLLVKEGEIIPGTFTCRRHTKDIRGLKVTILIKEKKYNYTLD
ncbi:Arginine methyltransferase 3 [Carabus blaptoides fortunei]